MLIKGAHVSLWHLSLPYTHISLAEAVCQQVKLYHPNNPNLEFLYGVMITDGKDDYSSEPMVNVLVLPRQVSFVGRIKW